MLRLPAKLGKAGHWLVAIGWLAIPIMVQTVQAHTVQVVGDVAVTFHLEPNHNPRAGRPAQVWFAFTRRGGQIIPLAQCECQLSIYTQPRARQATPLMRPPLKAIDAERYRGIPSAEITFAKPGTYELELKGAPKAGANFRSFTSVNTVVVR